MLDLRGWHLAFVAAVMGAGVAVLGYVEFRRLMNAAVDDRYGQRLRFYRWAEASLPAGSRLAAKLQYSIAFFFCHGVHDLTRLLTLLAFDLFVLFALLSPFWRYVYFNEWNPAAATALAVLGVSAYLVFKLRQGRRLCQVHEWSPADWRCQRCGEYHARAEELAEGAHLTGSPRTSFWDRLSWHGFWERRLEEMDRRVSPPTAG
jgi:hypothetical protein